MSEETAMAALVGAIVASLGLWWFRLVLPIIRRQSKTTRYGVYALVWLAYFILTIMVINRSGA